MSAARFDVVVVGSVELAERLHRERPAQAVIMFTRVGDAMARIKALEVGAADAVDGSFAYSQVAVRVGAAGRRAAMIPQPPERLEIDGCTFDLSAAIATRDGVEARSSARVGSMRGAVVIALWLALTATASADDVTFHGWTRDGKAVVFDGRAPWEGLGVCTPVGFDDKGTPLTESCTSCGTTPAQCGVTSKLGAASLRSPDKKLLLVKKQSCHISNDSPDTKVCVQTIGLGRLGRVQHDDEVRGRRGLARASAYFRRDSGAVVITFTGGSSDDKFVIDLRRRAR